MSKGRSSVRSAKQATSFSTIARNRTEHEFGNRLLDALPRADAERIVRHGTPIDMPLGMRLFDRESEPKYAYFLTEGMSSAVYTSRGGRSMEVATVGTEGVVGWLSLLGPFEAVADSMMQVAGKGYRLPMAALRHEFDRCAAFHGRMLEFAQHQLLVAYQTAACNHLHVASQRFARWLLMVEDRIGSQELHMTQEFLANLLGTRRPTMAETASALQKSGAIKYSRGNVRILKRRLLEKEACECYAALQKRFHGLYTNKAR